MTNNSNRRKGQEEYEYIYFKNHEGRIQRIRKPNFEARPGYIRLKFLEKWYIKYIRSSYDTKLMWLPWLIGLTTCFFIYQGAMLWSQNDLNREIKAHLPFEYKNQQVQQVYRLLKQHEQQQKKLKSENLKESE